MAVAHKGSISMGLVLIPIGMYKTSQDNDIHFNQLDKESKARIKYKKYCSHCGKEVTSADIIKGYEYEKDKYVVMTDEELEKIKTKKDKTIHIIQFAKMAEVNMIYYEKDYYAVPDAGAEKAYELLRQSLLSQKKVAIAKTVIGTNEKLLVLYPTKDGIIVKTLFYHDEIVAMPKPVPKMKLDENELAMAKMLIENMTRPFVTDRFKIELEASRYPASYVAFDCIYAGKRELVWEPLVERKNSLSELVIENSRLAVSRYIEEQGMALYQAAEARKLEGVVAKRKNSIYYMGKKSNEWTKFKRMADEDYVVAGYIQKGRHTYSLVIGKYRGEILMYKGHVTSGVTSEAVSMLKVTGRNPFRMLPTENKDAVWVELDHVCTVEYMPNLQNSLRQPVFKGFRDDIFPKEVQMES